MLTPPETVSALTEQLPSPEVYRLSFIRNSKSERNFPLTVSRSTVNPAFFGRSSSRSPETEFIRIFSAFFASSRVQFPETVSRVTLCAVPEQVILAEVVERSSFSARISVRSMMPEMVSACSSLAVSPSAWIGAETALTEILSAVQLWGTVTVRFLP